MKRCRKCGELKPLTAFYPEKNCRDGCRNDCKACFAARSKEWYRRNREQVIAKAKRWQQANAERHNAYQREYRANHKQQFREGHLRRVFKLTAAEYEALLDAQGGGCAVCGRPPRASRSLHVDHNHETGVVRGLLCFSCNVGIGYFREDTLRLADAIVYLARGRHVLEPERAERELFVDLVCELLGTSCVDVERSTTIGIERPAPTGAEHTPE